MYQGVRMNTQDRSGVIPPVDLYIGGNHSLIDALVDNRFRIKSFYDKKTVFYRWLVQDIHSKDFYFLRIVSDESDQSSDDEFSVSQIAEREFNAVREVLQRNYNAPAMVLRRHSVTAPQRPAPIVQMSPKQNTGKRAITPRKVRMTGYVHYFTEERCEVDSIPFKFERKYECCLCLLYFLRQILSALADLHDNDYVFCRKWSEKPKIGFVLTQSIVVVVFLSAF